MKCGWERKVKEDKLRSVQGNEDREKKRREMNIYRGWIRRDEVWDNRKGRKTEKNWKEMGKG